MNQQESLNSSTITQRISLNPRRVLSTSQKFALRRGASDGIQNDLMAQSVQRDRIARFNNRQLFRAEAPERIAEIAANSDFRDGFLSRRFPIAGTVFQRNLLPQNNLESSSDAIKSTDISQISSPQSSHKSWNTLRTPHFGRQAPSLFSSPTNSAGKAESEGSLQDFHDIAAAEEDLKGEPSKLRNFSFPILLIVAGMAFILSARFAFPGDTLIPMILFMLAGLSCLVVSYNFQRLRQKKQLAQGIYNEAADLLLKNRKACLKELVLHFEKKYGKEVVTETWPLVEALRVSSGKVLVFKDAFQGSYEIFWSI